jgi:3-dehydroquinate synthase
MPSFAVATASHTYESVVERGCLARLGSLLPARAGRLFVVTTEDVWTLHSARLEAGLGGRPFHTLFFPGGEENKRLAQVEALADQMLALGGDRTSVVIAFGGGIVTDLAGFLAAVFMRGIPVIQCPTTLLAQVDAGVGGKTGANLTGGKNLIGAFWQPLAVLADPGVLVTLPRREYVAGLHEVIKCGIIASEPLFRVMQRRSRQVLDADPETVEHIIAESVRIKCQVVSADEREGGLRRILNFGHTVGHAIEAETGYTRFLHGEAVALGMKAAAHLSRLTGRLSEPVAGEIIDCIGNYGPIPSASDLAVDNLLARLTKDKKTIHGTVHFVLATSIGSTEVVAGIDPALVRAAIELSLA